ncbi:MAG: YigZ family protein [Candidatus Heimdallarchaeota archaeon]|nr:YigZ family protein [Candidatus Heimdallarchaeota archaeon]
MAEITQAMRGPKIKIKRSIFFASIYPIHSEKELENNVKNLRAEFPKASHHAYAYILEGRADYFDDGEVKGTAGRVILQNLENQLLNNVLLVVTRIYGGVNLGKGGLIKAYSQTAKDLLDFIIK